MPGQIFRASDRSFAPWKNGGGDTAEVRCHPPGPAFDWRISTARVASSGPFSTFSKVDRVMTILEGGPLRLSLPDQILFCDADSGPFAFAGDVPCVAELLGPPVLNLNVMVRRPFRARVGHAPAIPSAAALAAYVFAAAPCLGLEQYDLAEWREPGPAAPAWLIEIL